MLGVFKDTIQTEAWVCRNGKPNRAGYGDVHLGLQSEPRFFPPMSPSSLRFRIVWWKVRNEPRRAANRKATMKKLILAVIGFGIAAVLVFYVSRPKAQPIVPGEPGAEVTAISANETQPAESVTPTLEPAAPPQETASAPGSNSLPAASTPNPILENALVSRTVDVLVATDATYQQKREAWKQLRDSGKLDQAIAELEKRTASDPRSAAYPAALGQAYLQKCGTIKDLREQGILAMQADKVFDTALSLDPLNWEARFTKAVALSYWPPMLNKADEVIQHFQTLIQQQETQAPQPQFAESYAWLGDQYQKAGRSEDARAVWQRGVVLFPADEKLNQKLASKP